MIAFGYVNISSLEYCFFEIMLAYLLIFLLKSFMSMKRSVKIK
jgi:hypothetical protein